MADFDETKVNRWPARAPDSRGGQFARRIGVGAPDWASKAAGELRPKSYQAGRWEATRETEPLGWEGAARKSMGEAGLSEAEIDAELQRLRSGGPAPVLTIRNGPHTIQDYLGMPPELIQGIAGMVDDLIKDFPPLDGQPVNISVVPPQGMPSWDENNPGKEGGGATIAGTGYMWLNVTALTVGPQGRFWMPQGQHVPPMAYVIAHEWGHVIDRDPEATDPERKILFEQTSPGMSTYGQSHPAEGYAEAFAEWYLSGGMTMHPVPAMYAEKYGWRVPT